MTIGMTTGWQTGRHTDRHVWTRYYSSERHRYSFISLAVSNTDDDGFGLKINDYILAQQLKISTWIIPYQGHVLGVWNASVIIGR